MKRLILPALLLPFCVLSSFAQFDRYGGRDAERTVAQWYRRFLDREADPQAINWIRALRSGQDPDQVLSGILGSDEYYNRAGATPRAFVSQLYEDLTGKAPVPREGEHWTRQLYFRSRSDVAYAILTRQAGNWQWEHRDKDWWSDNHDYRRPYQRYK